GRQTRADLQAGDDAGDARCDAAGPDRRRRFRLGARALSFGDGRRGEERGAAHADDDGRRRCDHRDRGRARQEREEGESAMRRLVLAVLLATGLHAATGLAADSIDAHVKQADGWVAWDVPMVADAGAPCCYSDKPGHGFNRSGCDLDDRHRNFSTNDDPRPPGTDTLTVYAHVAHG